MMARRNIVLCVWGAMACMSASAQKWEPSSAAVFKSSLLRNEQQVKAMTDMRLTTTIAAYSNATDAVPNDKGSSVVWRHGDRYKAEHLGMTTYQNKDIRIVVDPELRTIILNDPNDLFVTLGTSLQDSLLRSAQRIGRVLDGGGLRYRLKMREGSTYDVLEVSFDAKGWMRQIVMYWAAPVALEPNNPRSPTVLPKVVVNMEVPEPIAKELMDVDPSAVVSWNTEKPTGKGQWKDFTIYDSRPK